MKELVKFFYNTLIIIQILFIFLYVSETSLFIKFINDDGETNLIKLFFPLIVYGVIKMLYWIAEPISELVNEILKYILFFMVIYFVYWLFFV